MSISGFWEIFNDETGWLKTFQEESWSSYENETPLPSDDEVSDELDLSISDRSAAVRGEIQSIRKIWREGYDVETGKIYKLEPIIEALNLFYIFIKKYWHEFNVSTKLKLIEQAYKTKLVNPSQLFVRDNLFKNLQILTITFRYYFNNTKRVSTKKSLFQLQKTTQKILEIILTMHEKDLQDYENLKKEYDSLEETAYLLRSPVNANRLLNSLKEIKAGKGIDRELIE